MRVNNLIVANLGLLFFAACVTVESPSDPLPSVDINATVEALVVSKLAESTPMPPTLTPIPPTATPLPPTATPLPPTATPIPPTVTPTQIPTSTPLNNEVKSVSEIYESVKETVVRIETDNGTGTGFFISNDGLIVTNAHVIEDFKIVTVTLFNGQKLEGQVLGKKDLQDLGLIKIKALNMQYLDFTSYIPIKVGDTALAIGYASSLFGDPTLTKGYVSALRDNCLGAFQGISCIQTDAALNPGNSGGPLFNDKGQLIGINTFILENTEGLNFATNINSVKHLIEELVLLPYDTNLVLLTPTPTPTSTLKSESSKQASNLLAGPWSGSMTAEDGNIAASPEVYVDARNTVVSADFVRPLSTYWTQGFFFRRATDDWNKILLSELNGEGSIIFVQLRLENGEWEIIPDENNQISVNLESTINTLKVITIENSAYVFLNEEFVTVKIFDSIIESGGVYPIAANYSENFEGPYEFKDYVVREVSSLDVQNSYAVSSKFGSQEVQFIDGGDAYNFIISMDVTAPEIEYWSFGLVFRRYSTPDFQVVAFTNKTFPYKGYWEHSKYINSERDQVYEYSDNFDTSNNDHRFLLIADKHKGYLFLNSILLSVLDLGDYGKDETYFETSLLGNFFEETGSNSSGDQTYFNNILIYDLGRSNY